MLPFGALAFGAALYDEPVTLPAVAGAALVAAGLPSPGGRRGGGPAPPHSGVAHQELDVAVDLAPARVALPSSPFCGVGVVEGELARDRGELLADATRPRRRPGFGGASWSSIVPQIESVPSRLSTRSSSRDCCGQSMCDAVVICQKPPSARPLASCRRARARDRRIRLRCSWPVDVADHGRVAQEQALQGLVRRRRGSAARRSRLPARALAEVRRLVGGGRRCRRAGTGSRAPGSSSRASGGRTRS